MQREDYPFFGAIAPGCGFPDVASGEQHGLSGDLAFLSVTHLACLAFDQSTRASGETDGDSHPATGRPGRPTVGCL